MGRQTVEIRQERKDWDSDWVVHRCSSEAEAGKWVRDQEKIDPKGVRANKYHILNRRP